MKNIYDIDGIIKCYKDRFGYKKDRHVKYYSQQLSLINAIDVAARAVDERDKIHRHQWRIGREKLLVFKEKLEIIRPDIEKAKNFDELLLIVEAVNCKYIGELTYYDTAIRIGYYLNISPDKIYLHAGTREGVKCILNNINAKRFITIDELPVSFLNYDLTASDFEDIFCIFKNYFKNPSASSLKIICGALDMCC